MTAILLATYNSERYLEQQMESLLSQTCQDWQLYVRDDQSTDATLEMLHLYLQKDKRVHLLPDTEKRGAKHSFMWMLGKVEADFYMFCDHDDVWLPTKVERSMAVMMQQEDKKDTPLIVCCNTKLVDAQLNVIAESYWKHKAYRQSMFADKYYHLYYNNVLGCTMCFNRKARDMALPYPHDTAMHDSWLAAVVLWKKGRIVPVDEPLMLYRQHGDNTVGAPPMPSIWQQLKNGPQLWRKTKLQHDACQVLTTMPFMAFFLLKLRYMLQTHWYAFLNKKK